MFALASLTAHIFGPLAENYDVEKRLFVYHKNAVKTFYEYNTWAISWQYGQLKGMVGQTLSTVYYHFI